MSGTQWKPQTFNLNQLHKEHNLKHNNNGHNHFAEANEQREDGALLASIHATKLGGGSDTSLIIYVHHVTFCAASRTFILVLDKDHSQSVLLCAPTPQLATPVKSHSHDA